MEMQAKPIRHNRSAGVWKRLEVVSSGKRGREAQELRLHANELHHIQTVIHTDAIQIPFHNFSLKVF